MVNWGTFRGKLRNPCPEKPELLLGQPLGMYHCPYCGDMQMAGCEHLPPDEEYEGVTGMEWPAGYEEKQ